MGRISDQMLLPRPSSWVFTMYVATMPPLNSMVKSISSVKSRL